MAVSAKSLAEQLAALEIQLEEHEQALTAAQDNYRLVMAEQAGAEESAGNTHGTTGKKSDVLFSVIRGLASAQARVTDDKIQLATLHIAMNAEESGAGVQPFEDIEAKPTLKGA